MGLVCYVFSLPEVKENQLALLSQHICQDPLENFFGCQRQRGGTSDNPSAQEYYRNAQALRYPCLISMRQQRTLAYKYNVLSVNFEQDWKVSGHCSISVVFSRNRIVHHTILASKNFQRPGNTGE